TNYSHTYPLLLLDQINQITHPTDYLGKYPVITTNLKLETRF
ncbi:MAG: hypothetical protein ACJAVI_001852, partial [Candidatus Azotimanducaceae bacterium]